MGSIRYILLFLLLFNAYPASGQTAHTWGRISGIISPEDIFSIVEGKIEIGARALGFGGSYVSVGDDYSGTFYNPASLTRVKRMEIFNTLSIYDFSNNTVFHNTVKNNDPLRSMEINSFGFLIPFSSKGKNLVLAAGINRSYNANSSASFSGINSFQTLEEQQEDVKTSGGITEWSVSSGYTLSESFSIGISANFLRGDISNSFKVSSKPRGTASYPDVLQSGDTLIVSESRDASPEMTGFNYRVGALLELVPGFFMGISFFYPGKLMVDERWSVNRKEVYEVVPDTFGFKTSSLSGEWRYGIKVPPSYSASISLQIFNLLISSTLEYTDWPKTEILEPSTAIVRNSDFSQYYRATTITRIGVEAAIERFNMRIRGGYIFNPSILKNNGSIDFVTEERIKDGPIARLRVEEEDRVFITGGVGMLFKDRLMVDVGYLTGSWVRRSIDDGIISIKYTEGLNSRLVEEHITVNKYFISLSIRM
ncbi:MAG: OmpP1/FadL family transporter [Fidelibacterota bacterium]